MTVAADFDGILFHGHSLTQDHIKTLLPLGSEDVALVIDGFPAPERLRVIRALHDMRKAAKEETDFEADVEDNRAKKKARREADARDRAEREAYLSSAEGRTEGAAAFESGIIDPEDLEDPAPLIDGFLHMDTVVRTFGPPKSLKSFATLDMAACVSLGRPWQGHATHQTRVLYVIAEGARGVKHRKRAWNEHHQDEMKVIFYGKAVQIGDQEEMHNLISYCVVKQIGYVIFDTQARCTVGVNENDNTEMGEIVASLDVLRQQTGACVHLVHHSVGSDDSKARGATAWDGAVDAEFLIKRDRQDRTRVNLVTKFQKDISEANDVEMQTIEVGSSLVLTATPEPTASGKAGEIAPALVTDGQTLYLEAIRMFGPGGATVSDVTADLNDRGIKRTRTAVKKAFGGLLSGGAISQTGKGTGAVITQAGLVYLDAHRKATGERSEEGLWEPQKDG